MLYESGLDWRGVESGTTRAVEKGVGAYNCIHVISLSGSRQDLKATLTCIDEEHPRGPDSISSRVTLARELRIERLLERNRAGNRPLRTMIEMIIRYMLEASEKRRCGGRREEWKVGGGPDHLDMVCGVEEKVCLRRIASCDSIICPFVPTLRGITKVLIGDRKRHLGGDLCCPNAVIDLRLDGNERKPSDVKKKPPTLGKCKVIQGRHGRYHEDDTNGEEKSHSVGPPAVTVSQHPALSPKRAQSQDQDILRAKEQVLLSSLGEGYRNCGDDNAQRLGPNKQNLFHMYKSASDLHIDREPSQGWEDPVNLDTNVQPPGTDITCTIHQPNGVNHNNNDSDEQRGESPRSVNGQDSNEVSPSSPSSGPEEATSVRVSEVEDVPCGPSMISLHMAVQLKEVVFGSATGGISPQWLGQGFTFNTQHKLRYGFVQKKVSPTTSGGACGVLATVQAFLLKTLLFDPGSCVCTEPLRPTRNEARAALVTALTDVLWQAGEGESAVLAVCSDVAHLRNCSRYRMDGLTEGLTLHGFRNRDHLAEAVRQHLDQFSSGGGNGCLLLVFSAALSRGLHRLRGDMDEASPLIGRSGHCVQELVNLLMTGRACSNVFDNTTQVDACTLKGVHARSGVGFLSLFEHYNSCQCEPHLCRGLSQVGSYLKTPRYPVWVVCSESHFTVLFCCKRELLSDWRAEKHFHLYYYDGMARQEQEIKLTVGERAGKGRVVFKVKEGDTTGLQPAKVHQPGNRTPPLEHCIRTKWKDAVVDWNGYRASSFSSS
uniref:Ubiquitin carboxyl-terminal hydrolase MINDY n=1 Tax=Timema genevievae TaxID=629358 RepID=A0A7R9K6E2_TIMGE|nr:unnamed protein product [Timema genevievae]